MSRPERERRSFQDIAKLAVTPPPASTRPSRPSQPPSGVIRATEASEHDSGVVDLKAAAASDPMLATRAAQTPLASSGLFDDDDRTSAPPITPGVSGIPAPLSAPAVPNSPPSARSISAPLSTPRLPEPGEAKKTSKAAILGVGVVALAALAAGAFFVVRARQAPAGGNVATTAPAATETAVAVKATPEPAPTAAATPPGKADLVASADDAKDDPKSAPGSKAGPKKAIGGGGHAVASKPAAATPAENKPESKPEARPEERVDPKLVAKDLPAAPAVTGALGDAMKQAAGPAGASADNANAGPAQPQYEPGSVPQKPSQGAVTGAIGAALPGARACLHADEPVSRATITFGSTGTVTSVLVTGGAAGKPAEACIKTALGKAKVPPFAQPSYTASVTVRPNG